MEDAKKGLFNAILVWKIDRFGRDTLSGLSAIELLRKYNIEIISITEPFDLNTATGRFQFITYLNMAELERNNILDRMFLGATRAAKKGKWLGGIVPYGYEVNADGYLQINEEEAKVVKEIYNLYVNKNYTSIDISMYLNSLNIPTNSFRNSKGKRRKGLTGKWRHNSILRILSSSTYKGIHEYGKRGTRRKETISRNVPAIIDEEIWNKAQIQKQKNNYCNPRNCHKRTYLLSGILKCERCGRNFQGVSYKDKSSVYVCATKRGDKKRILGETCDNINVNAEVMEETMWSLVKQILLNYEKVIPSLNKSKISSNEKKKNLLKLKEEFNKKDKEKDKILTLFRKDLISEDDVEKEIKAIKDEKNRLNKLILQIENNLVNCQEKLNSFTETIIEYKKSIVNCSREKKKEIIKYLIKEVLVNFKIENGRKELVIKPTLNFNVNFNVYKDMD
ncbi:recombinase family protein [Clostridium fallax]